MLESHSNSEINPQPFRSPIGQQAEQLAIRLFNQRKDSRLVFHNYQRSQKIVSHIYQLGQMENIWSKFSADPFNYNFVDEAFAKAYNAEQRFSTLIGSFTFLAIVVSIIGLFGLINFITQLKLKEISIRRILGASQISLMQMVGQDFMMIFLAASLFALPVSYYFMNTWLANYAYHIPINFSVLFLAVILCIIISTLVIFYHLLRTTQVNPTEALSAE